jgi:hypothetical protein
MRMDAIVHDHRRPLRTEGHVQTEGHAEAIVVAAVAEASVRGNAPEALAHRRVIGLARGSADAIGARAENNRGPAGGLGECAPVCDDSDFIGRRIDLNAGLDRVSESMHDDRSMRGTIDLPGEIAM